MVSGDTSGRCSAAAAPARPRPSPGWGRAAAAGLPEPDPRPGGVRAHAERDPGHDQRRRCRGRRAARRRRGLLLAELVTTPSATDCRLRSDAEFPTWTGTARSRRPARATTSRPERRPLTGEVDVQGDPWNPATWWAASSTLHRLERRRVERRDLDRIVVGEHRRLGHLALGHGSLGHLTVGRRTVGHVALGHLALGHGALDTARWTPGAGTAPPGRREWS